MQAENPKTAQGQKKPPLHLIPSTALLMEAEAMRNGAEKYGPYNWRITKVPACTYISAAQRHIAAFLDGEPEARDSGVHHLAHARACLGILLDAIVGGHLIDDRPEPGEAAALIEALARRRLQAPSAIQVPN